uniref:RRM domain-containing protein n=1 Tax=Neobodo designis TaxID=312471 RepID=A0A7S1L0H6_NEODS|mmetsp:Transcript_12401/g.38579  ORF Transcript_12401/g.38579 Transcript_12401/m.38579 type:complete len:430 (+) Transcript_12401:161-1450(+)
MQNGALFELRGHDTVGSEQSNNGGLAPQPSQPGQMDALTQQFAGMTVSGQQTAPPQQQPPLHQSPPLQQQQQPVAQTAYYVSSPPPPMAGGVPGTYVIAQPGAPQPMTTSPGNSRSSATSRRQSDKSLFVSGLHPACEFTHLHERFQQYGKIISCRVLRDAKTGHSRCIGYVNFANAPDAGRALAEENGRPGPQGGGALSIRYAEDDPAFVPEETRKLFIRYVPLSSTTEHVRQAFSQFGNVTECSVMPDISSAAKAEAEPWSMAYVTFATAEEATLACAKSHRSFLLGERHELAVKPAETLATRAQRQRKHDGSASSRGGSLMGSASAAASASYGYGSGSSPHGMAAAPMQMQMAPPQQQQPQMAPQIVVPPGYQLAYLPGANGALTPVLIPTQQQQAPQPQQQQVAYGGVPQQMQAGQPMYTMGPQS